MTKVLHITYDAFGGGAGRAASRIHTAVLSCGIDSRIRSARIDPKAGGATPSALASRFYFGVRARSEAMLNTLTATPNASPRWTAALPSSWSTAINTSTYDLVHLHWICGGMMSIEDIGRIRKPIVWTMHDMWAFCGAENLAYDERYAAGYTAASRHSQERGLDLNAWTWRRKRRTWTKGWQIVAPSRWMAACVKRSTLMADWQVAMVPNPIDTDFWSPRDRSQSQTLLGIGSPGHVLCVAGVDGGVSPHKGYDLFADALRVLARRMPVTVLVIGHAGTWRPRIDNVSFQFLGLVTDDEIVRASYCAADAVIVPSRIDNLPNTAVEAMSCGIPVVAFDVGGLPDIVSHKVSGYLARPFDTADLANGIEWVLSHDDHERLRHAARALTSERFAMRRVGLLYRHAYDAALAEN